MKNTKENDKEVANRMKGMLTQKNIRFNALAEVMDVSPCTVYQKLSGGSALTVTELSRIAAACRLTREDVNYIIFGR